jgi:D-serine dehydratase
MVSPERSLSVYDIGLDNCTEADGLAVARASELAYRMVKDLVTGCYTVTDAELLKTLYALHDRMLIDIEPSSAVAFLGLARNPEASQAGATIFWTTGGSLTPVEEQHVYLRRARVLLDEQGGP